MVLFFSQFSQNVTRLAFSEDPDWISKNFRHSAILNLSSAAQYLEKRNPIVWRSLLRLLSLFLHPSWFFYSAGDLLLCEDKSTFRRTCSLLVFCNSGTLEDAENHTMDLESSFEVILARLLEHYSRWTAPSGRPAFRRIFLLILRRRLWSGRRLASFPTFAVLVAETAGGSCCPPAFRVPLIAIFLLLFNAV